MTSLAYTVVDAFSIVAFRGNPAAVIILPPSFELPDETLLALAQEFNLPMTAFVYLDHTHDSFIPTGSAFRLRWFNPQHEAHFCGHATLAAAHVLFSRAERVRANIHEIPFTTLAGQLQARKIGSRIELIFPAGEVLSVDDIYERGISFRDSVVRAARLKGEESIKAVGEGGGGDSFKHFMVVELDPSVQLKELRPDVTHFDPFAPRSIILTTKGTGDETYFLRVFVNHGGYQEDAVTGSANACIASYWARKLGYSEGSNQVMRVKQLSHRSGDLEVIWDGDRVRLRATARVTAEGTVYL